MAVYATMSILTDVKIHLLHRNTVADAFWNAELQDELRERG